MTLRAGGWRVDVTRGRGTWSSFRGPNIKVWWWDRYVVLVRVSYHPRVLPW